MASFKDSWETDSTFTGGFKDPNEILIVGVDLPVEDWNAAVSDIDRLPLALANPIDPESMLATINAGGSVPGVEVTKINGKVLCVEGRRRIICARLVRKLQAKAGLTADELLKIPFTPSKGTDLQINVRRGNLGRFDDPPYIKARQVARMRASGTSDAVIAKLYQVEPHTLGSWAAYMNLDPDLQRLVEDETLPPEKRLTWNAAIELGRMGEGEFAKQRLVVDVIINTGSVIKGERGRENFRRVCAAVKAGEITEAPPPVGAPVPESDPEDDGPEVPAAPTAAGKPGVTPLKLFDPKSKQPPHLAECAKGGCMGAKKCPAAAWNVAKAQAGSPPVGGNTKAPAPAATPEAPAPKGGKRAAPASDNVTTLGLMKGGKLSLDAIRQVFSNIEPTEAEPLENEGERAVFAALAVIVGQDPTGEALKEWPYLYKHFKPALRSSLVTK